MRILVTGATGFIGSAFAGLALGRGHTIGGVMLPDEKPPFTLSPSMNRKGGRVTPCAPSESAEANCGAQGVTRPTTAPGSGEPFVSLGGSWNLSPSDGERVAGWPEEGGMTWLRGTLADLPWREIEAFAPEACVHFAWIATPGVYLESPENEQYLKWSLDLAQRLKGLGVRQFVGAGTCIEYQIADAPLNEDRTPVNPASVYARCKNGLRETLAAEARKDGSVFAWGRVFYPYGVGEHPARLCSSIIQKLGRDETLRLKTPDSTKDYIYITDLAAAFLTVVEKRFRGTINLGTGTGVSVRDLAHRLAALMGKQGLIEEVRPPEPDPFPFVVADAGKLKSLGWQPAVSLEDGLTRLVAVARA